MVVTAEKRKAGGKRAKREGDRQSLNLSVLVSHHKRFCGLALLLGLTPSELFMRWVEQQTVGLRFFMPGVGSADGQANRDGGARDAVEGGENSEPMTSLPLNGEGVAAGAGEGVAQAEVIVTPAPARPRRQAVGR